MFNSHVKRLTVGNATALKARQRTRILALLDHRSNRFGDFVYKCHIVFADCVKACFFVKVKGHIYRVAVNNKSNKEPTYYYTFDTAA